MTRRDDPDDIFNEIDKMMDRMLSELDRILGKETDTFENLESTNRETATHIDVLDEDDVVRVIADVPGVEKEDINLNATESVLRIRASRGGRSYDEEIDLPTKVDPDSATANYNNGVLEVSFEKKRSQGKNIEIE